MTAMGLIQNARFRCMIRNVLFCGYLFRIDPPCTQVERQARALPVAYALAGVGVRAGRYGTQIVCRFVCGGVEFRVSQFFQLE